MKHVHLVQHEIGQILMSHHKRFDDDANAPIQKCHCNKQIPCAQAFSIEFFENQIIDQLLITFMIQLLR